MSTNHRGNQPRLTHTQLTILHAFLTFHYLSADLVCKLFFAYPSSLRYAQKLLAALAAAGYLTRLFLPRTTRAGSAPMVYTVASPGRAMLKREGFAVPSRSRPSEERGLSYLFLSHSLDLSAILVAAHHVSRVDPAMELRQVLHERALRRNPPRVALPDGARGTLSVAVIPDAWLDFRVTGKRACLLLECDRASENEHKWRRKVAALLAFADDGYEQRFGTRSLTITVIATAGGERRLRELVRWTERELDGAGRGQDRDLFRLTHVEPAAIDPTTLWTKPVWYRPFDRVATALFASVPEEERR